MLLYGAGGHAKVIVDAIIASGQVAEGLFDDADVVDKFQEVPFFGKYDPARLPGSPLIIAVGNSGIRRQLSGNIVHSFGIVVHPSAIVAPSVSVGGGTVILHRAVVQAHTKIGRHCIINTGAIADHDCVLEDYVHLAPGAVLCGGVEVGEETLVGANATVTPYVKIGRRCTVGAGAVVTRHLADGMTVAAGSKY